MRDLHADMFGGQISAGLDVPSEGGVPSPFPRNLIYLRKSTHQQGQRVQGAVALDQALVSHWMR